MNGACCGKIEEGNDGSVLGSGVGMTARGFSRRGSTDLRYVV